MGRMYVARFDNVAVTVAQDLMSIATDDDKVVVLHEARFTQNTDAGDAESEQLRFTLTRAASGFTAGSGGSSVNAEALDPGDAADSATVRANDTTVATGTMTDLLSVAEHVQAGWHYLPTPETRPVVAGGAGFIFSLDAAPADSITMSGYVIFEEIG